jgi:hypothetical protein
MEENASRTIQFWKVDSAYFFPLSGFLGSNTAVKKLNGYEFKETVAPNQHTVAWEKR